MLPVGREVDFEKNFTIKSLKNNWNSIGFDGWESDLLPPLIALSIFFDQIFFLFNGKIDIM